MADFGFIAEQAIDVTDTRRFVFTTIRINGGMAFVMCKPAIDENTEYLKAGVLADANDAASRITQAAAKDKKTKEALVADTIDGMAEKRDRDIPIFAKHIVADWGIIYPTEKSPETSTELTKSEHDDDIFTGPMMDGKGEVVACEFRAVESFLRAVHTRSINDFNNFRVFCQNPENFRPEIKVEALAKK